MPIHALNCILLLDYKFTFPKYNINNTRSAGLEVCVTGRSVVWVLDGTICHSVLALAWI